MSESGKQSEKKAKAKKININSSKGSKSKSSNGKSSNQENGKEQEVLLNLPAGMKYKLPGKQQRIILGSIVVGLNILLVIAVILYLYNPSFQEFIFNIGRDWKL